MNNKFVFLILFALIIAAPTSAQDTMLTKEETINYLNKKAREADGGYRTWAGQRSKTRYAGLSLKLSADLVEIGYKAQAENAKIWVNSICRFNPAYIKSWNFLGGGQSDTVGILEVKFVGNTVKCDSSYTNLRDGDRMTGPSHVANYIWFPFLDAEPSNRARIDKAFKHLTDLVKAEDDPFDN